MAIELDRLFVVVATDDERVLIDVEMDELNVENPVVPVILTCELPEINVVVCDVIEPLTFNAPVIDVFVLTLNPLVETEAVFEPLAICDRFKPVTPEAWMLYKPSAFPLNEPVKTDAVTEPDIRSIEP